MAHVENPGLPVPVAEVCGAPDHAHCHANPDVPLPPEKTSVWYYGGFRIEDTHERPGLPLLCPACFEALLLAGLPLSWGIMDGVRVHPDWLLDVMRAYPVNGRPLGDYSRDHLLRVREWATAKEEPDLRRRERLSRIAGFIDHLIASGKRFEIEDRRRVQAISQTWALGEDDDLNAFLGLTPRRED